MGKRGQAPAPTGLRLVRGDRKDRINFDEPQAKEGVPQCPLNASPEVHKVWQYTVDQLSHMDILTMADRDVLYAYCEAVVMHRDASLMLAKEGFVIEGLHGGWVKHPAVQIQRDTANTMRSFAQEFGLTPSARSTIKLHHKEAEAAGAARLLS